MKQIQSNSRIDTPAVFIQSSITFKDHCLWCNAVSRGWKPSPGGVMYVWRMLDRTSTVPSGECLITPAPNLLAEPSSPRARYGRSEGQ